MKRASCGLDVHLPADICRSLKMAAEQGFEFICAPLVHPRYKREFVKKWKDRDEPLSRSDLTLKSLEWNSLIAGKISPYINVDSGCHFDQDNFALEQEISYGSHIEVPAMVISLKNSQCSNLARIVNSKLPQLNSSEIWIEIPLVSAYEEAQQWRSDPSELNGTKHCTWEWWNNFRTLCNCDKKLGVILNITRCLVPQKIIDRWMGEPIKCIIISTSNFLTNENGYPELPKAHEKLIMSLVRLNIQVIIKGNNHHDNYTAYKNCIEDLWQKAASRNKSKGATPENVIHYPLQPLSENLVSKTYRLFEKDSVKYRQYRKAVYSVLMDKFKSDEIINIMVVGAGRGPLVAASLVAAEKSNRKVKVFAVEKNPFAFVTLQTHKEELWGNSVEVILGDIRYLNFPRNIDIIVSELLGSFGDNELSPEVLDEAQKCLKSTGIFIPESYTSYLCPVQGSKIYSDLKSTKEKSDCEMPYVVKHRNKYNISKTNALFTFHHPNYDDSMGNTRYKRLTFDVEQNCVIHGFAGFFETVLYGDIKLSTLPESITPGLCSWNPFFFPLLDPMYLLSGSEIELHFWRIVGQTSVWYEWTITKPVPMPIHNSNGRSSNMSLR